MAAWPKSWAVSSVARWGREWGARRSELSIAEGEGGGAGVEMERPFLTLTLVSAAIGAP